MGSMKRKLERQKMLRKKKALDKAMRGVSEQVEKMPKICGECGADFDNTDKEMLNQWRIAVYDDGRFHLTCPSCGPTPEELEGAKEEKP